MIPLELVGWHEAGVVDAMVALAQVVGICPKGDDFARPLFVEAKDEDEHSRWLEAVADNLHMEIESVDCAHAELRTVLASLGPALVRVTTTDGNFYLAVIRSFRRSMQILTPKKRKIRIRTRAVYSALTSAIERESSVTRVDKWLAAARVTPARTVQARA